MLLQHLITFCRVVETGGFARAGALVGLSQPAVTRQVAALEAELGVPLLDRSGRQLHVTAAGQLVYDRARRIAQAVAALKEEVADLDDPERGRVAIGAVTTVGLRLLPPILAAFKAQYPRVQVTVKAGRTQETLARLLEGEIELAILPNPVAHPRLRSVPLMEDPVVLVCSPERRAELPDPLPLAKLGEVDLISFQAPSRFRTFVEAMLEQHGVYPKVTMEFDSHEAVTLMVEAGFGCALVPASAVERELAMGTLVQVRVDGLPAMARTTSVVFRHPSPGWSPAAERLYRMIVEHFGRNDAAE
ncbi:MAG: LysR family transcriptional regulator [Symbiobacterium sp.]|uniref:LysR family transcriptional regulator n=1 Tax=Symbiobacterium sp. TaxID=1971213 RepID=UPI00346411FF